MINEFCDGKVDLKLTIIFFFKQKFQLMNQIREKNDERLARLLHKQEASSSNKLASKHNLHKPLIDPLANRQAHNRVSIYLFAFSESKNINLACLLNCFLTTALS